MTTTADPVSTETLPPLVSVRSTRAASWSAFWALLVRDLTVLRKSFWEFVLRTVMQPLTFLFVFTYVLPKLSEGSGRDIAPFSSVLVAGMMALSVVMIAFQSVALPLVHELSVTREIEDRVMAPLPISWVAVEKIVAGAIHSLIAAAIVFPVAALVPATAIDLHVDWLALITIAPLACLTAAAGGLTFATLLDRRQLPMAFNFFLVPMTFLGAIFFPWHRLEAIPWLQYALLGNPIVYISEGFRAALLSSDPHIPLPSIYLALCGFSALFFAISVDRFTKRVQIGDEEPASKKKKPQLAERAKEGAD